MTNPVLHAVDLELRRDGHPVLAGLDWNVHTGERWVVLGPNGAGKSTLALALQGRLQPWKGTLEVLGIEFGKAPIQPLWKRVGYAGESLERLFPATFPLEELVASGRHGSIGYLFASPSRTDVARAREELSFWGLSDRFRQNYHTASLGERRKSLIARAMAGAPKLLVLDEPFAGLDPAAREELIERLSLLARLNPDLPIVLVTHHVEEIPPEWTHALLLPCEGMATTGCISDQLTSAKLSRLYGRKFQLRTLSGRRFLLPNS
jgi:iron complex transport system ATP-binding protein